MISTNINLFYTLFGALKINAEQLLEQNSKNCFLQRVCNMNVFGLHCNDQSIPFSQAHSKQFDRLKKIVETELTITSQIEQRFIAETLIKLLTQNVTLRNN